ncbi:MAG: Tetratricopeptide 2 repeat protein [Pedosphaera sp.]|nr:Tetratricopeptide 2 repeat protein [Pedosphaera sp.]
MLDCRHRGVWFLAIGTMMLAGCTSYTSPPPNRAGWEPPLLPRVEATAKPSHPVEVDQNLVRAYAHYAQGMIYDLDDQPNEAETELSKAAFADPSNADLVLELTRRYLQEKQPEKALEILNRAVTVPGASGVLFARQAVVYSRLGKDEPALEACQTAIKRDPALLDGYRALFYIRLQKNQSKEALKVLDQALHYPNTNAEFELGLVELYATLERQDPAEKVAIKADALAALNRAAGQNPASPQLRLKLGDAYNLLGDSTNAARIYAQLLDSRYEFPGLREKLVDIYWRQKNFKQAQEQLEAMVQEDPTNPKTYYLLGSLADEDKRFADAAAYFQKALLLSDNAEDLYYELARVQININQPKEALDTLERAKAHPNFKGGFAPEVLTALAYARQKDYTNALNHFTAAEVLAKATAPAGLTSGFYFDQGSTYERAGNFEQAEQCFEKSLQITPNFPEALNYLGYMWAERGVKLDRAREMIEKAVRLEPNSAAYLDSLGWVLYKLNRPQEALPNLQKAIQLTEEPDATLFDHLGDIYAALKQNDKAHDAWAKSISVEPNDQVRKKLGDVSGNSGR